MKIWVDDIRPPPEGWTWLKTSMDTIKFLEKLKASTEHKQRWNMDVTSLEVMSLDHDLGGDDTSRCIVLWMCENEFWPTEVLVHSANPTGIEWLEGMIERYHPSNAHKYPGR